jgi:hypothetical protein
MTLAPAPAPDGLKASEPAKGLPAGGLMTADSMQPKRKAAAKTIWMHLEWRIIRSIG